MLDAPLHLEDELGIVAICPPEQSHPLDLLARKRRQLARADEPDSPNAAAVGEGEALPLSVQLPPRLLVLHRAATALEAGIPLLPGTLLTRVRVEALDGCPGTGGGGLASLGVEVSYKTELMREAGAEDLQVVGCHTTTIHPQPQGFVADELGGADPLINRRGLGTGEVQLILIQ
jgi:hypothetical protein